MREKGTVILCSLTTQAHKVVYGDSLALHRLQAFQTSLLARNVIKQLKEKEQLVFMYVDFPPTHFEAYVPAIEVRSRPRQMVDLS